MRVLRPLPGDGLLARYGELVLLCDASERYDAQIPVLLDVITEVASGGGDGRRFGRRLAGLLGGAGLDDEDAFPALCAFGPSGTGLAVLVHGAAVVTAVAGGQSVRLDGSEAVTWVDRVLAGPVESIRGALTSAEVNSPRTGGHGSTAVSPELAASRSVAWPRTSRHRPAAVRFQRLCRLRRLHRLSGCAGCGASGRRAGTRSDNGRRNGRSSRRRDGESARRDERRRAAARDGSGRVRLRRPRQPASNRTARTAPMPRPPAPAPVAPMPGPPPGFDPAPRPPGPHGFEPPPAPPSTPALPHPLHPRRLSTPGRPHPRLPHRRSTLGGRRRRSTPDLPPRLHAPASFESAPPGPPPPAPRVRRRPARAVEPRQPHRRCGPGRRCRPVSRLRRRPPHRR